jgi:hypothetical protein
MKQINQKHPLLLSLLKKGGVQQYRYLCYLLKSGYDTAEYRYGDMVKQSTAMGDMVKQSTATGDMVKQSNIHACSFR